MRSWSWSSYSYFYESNFLSIHCLGDLTVTGFSTFVNLHPYSSKSFYRVSQKTLPKEMCDFLTLKILPLALAMIKTNHPIQKISIFVLINVRANAMVTHLLKNRFFLDAVYFEMLLSVIYPWKISSDSVAGCLSWIVRSLAS